MHAKSYRNAKEYKGKKKILAIGSNISAIDMLQYLVPECKKVRVSMNVLRINDFNSDDNAARDWIEEVLKNPEFGINLHPKIQHFP
ncbi:hypothetical protein KL935_001132 [Ogataea polymorpha]|nr:hypothetical protein KL935_001132 [Ogataea polymorpha]